MTITDIYTFFSRRKGIRRASLLVLTGLLAFLVSSLHFSEDISDFLPLGTREREQMSVYQNIAGADKLILLFSGPEDPDYTVEAIECFVETAGAEDKRGWCEHLTAQIDMDAIAAVSNYVLENAPYFLTEADLERMDSLLAVPGYLQKALDNDRQVLMFPSSPLVTGRITRDPLALFGPVMFRLQSSLGQSGFELYDNYIFSPDMSRAVLMLDSPFGSSETQGNAQLLSFLEGITHKMQQAYPGVSVDIIGGPAIAVGNSVRIKKDSILAISLSVVLIFLLLAYSFNSLRNILLIFLTVGWGLLFALGGLSVFRDNVSIIVIGIASVILGIAINYPLHLISHSAYYQPDRKLALKEILSPLVVGNITTVGAFLALIPLKSTALRDLGLFASLLLVGTILFVLFYLPHYMEVKNGRKRDNRVLEMLSTFSPEHHRWLVAGTVILTVVLLFFSFRTQFDANISHINYMSPEQSREMQYFEDLMTHDVSHTAQTLYVYGSGSSEEEAIRDIRGREVLLDSLARCGKLTRQNEALSFFCSREEQQARLDRWKLFVQRHRQMLTTELAEAARTAGFAPGAFDRFYRLVQDSSTLEPQEADLFEPLRETVFSQSTTSVDGKSYLVCPVNVEPEDMEAVKSVLGGQCFEIAGINKAMASSLSDNFNYIGWACSLIVFLFLWFSFGRLELALISFLPMAVSWVWILGLMALLGIKFNIVNIILATFIFGQGDDYTIFMTEGCQYEYSRRKPILKAFKSSILQSAAIMFAGIGTLIVARHPAMHSLAEVTIVGMFSVVLMAYLIPPLLFRWMTQGRRYPVTLKSLLTGIPKDAVSQVMGRYIYKGKEIERPVRRRLREEAATVLEMPLEGTVDYADSGYGELSILLALTHPDGKVIAHIPDEERRRIAQIAADGFVNNIVFVQ